MKPKPTDTLAEGKKYLREHFKDGVDCPCCGKLVKLWAYQIHSTMARLLIALYNLSIDQEYVHINDLWQHIGNKSMGGDFSKLLLWELIEQMPKDEKENKRATGYWKITDAGKLFVTNKLRIPKKFYVFDGRVYEEEGETGIIEVLHKNFNYFELIGKEY